jgi:pimeloyl-ACP methyl ester carboxylesterase
VVVASDSPYSTFIVVYNDGRAVTRTPQGNPGDAGHTPAAIHLAETLVPIWAADLKFELDQMQQLDDSDPDGRFTHRLDLQNVGVFGHSFGGAAALRFCRDDPRCRAGIDIDGIPFGSAGRGGMSKPFLFLLGEHGGEAGSGEILAQFHAIERGLPNQPNEITLAGARHFNFSDMALLKEHLLGRVSGLLGPIDARRGLAASADCVSAFFDTYLKHQPDALRGGRPGYPEVRVAPAGVQ